MSDECLPNDPEDLQLGEIADKLYDLQEENVKIGQLNRELAAKLKSATSQNKSLGYILFQLDQEIQVIEEKIGENREKTEIIETHTAEIRNEADEYKKAIKKESRNAELFLQIKTLQENNNQIQIHYQQIKKLAKEYKVNHSEESVEKMKEHIHYLYQSNLEFQQQYMKIREILKKKNGITLKDDEIFLTSEFNERIVSLIQEKNKDLNGIVSINELITKSASKLRRTKSGIINMKKLCFPINKIQRSNSDFFLNLECATRNSYQAANSIRYDGADYIFDSENYHSDFYPPAEIEEKKEEEEHEEEEQLPEFESDYEYEYEYEEEDKLEKPDQSMMENEQNLQEIALNSQVSQDTLIIIPKERKRKITKRKVVWSKKKIQKTRKKIIRKKVKKAKSSAIPNDDSVDRLLSDELSGTKLQKNGRKPESEDELEDGRHTLRSVRRIRDSMKDIGPKQFGEIEEILNERNSRRNKRKGDEIDDENEEDGEPYRTTLDKTLVDVSDTNRSAVEEEDRNEKEKIERSIPENVVNSTDTFLSAGEDEYEYEEEEIDEFYSDYEEEEEIFEVEEEEDYSEYEYEEEEGESEGGESVKKKRRKPKELVDFSVIEDDASINSENKLASFINTIRSQTTGESNEKLLEYLGQIQKEIRKKTKKKNHYQRELEKFDTDLYKPKEHRFQYSRTKGLTIKPPKDEINPLIAINLHSSATQTEVTTKTIQFQTQIIEKQQKDMKIALSRKEEYDEIQAQVDEIDQLIENMESQKAEVNTQIEQVLVDLEEVKDELAIADAAAAKDEEIIPQYEAQIEQLDLQYNEKRKILDKLDDQQQNLLKTLQEMQQFRLVLESQLDDLYNREKPEIRQLIEEEKNSRISATELNQKVVALAKSNEEKRKEIDAIEDSEEMQERNKYYLKSLRMARRLKKWTEISQSNPQIYESFSLKNNPKRVSLVEQVKEKESMIFSKQNEVESLDEFNNMLTALINEHHENWEHK